MAGIVDQALDAALAAVLVGLALRDVTRPRLERFAVRQGLVVTVDNGPVVIDYLARTRRWRTIGFVAGLLIAYGSNFTQRHPWNVGGAGAFVGWFLGAIAAEWRLESVRAVGVRRAASLATRRLTDYVPRPLLIGNFVVWLAALGFGAEVIIDVRPLQYSAAVELAGTVVVTVVTAFVARRVLLRPQAVARADVIAADDALRSRSLHVLAGALLATNGILLALMATIGATQRHSWGNDVWVTMVIAIAGLGLPIVGWLVARSSFAVHRPGISTRPIGVAPVILDVDTSSPVPPYEQIRAQVTTLADTGGLTVGTRLPPIRQLAADLALAPGTVARAYRELEATGVVTSRVRHGTVVAARGKPSAAAARQQLSAAAQVFAAAVATLGADRDAAVAELDRHLGELRALRAQA